MSGTVAAIARSRDRALLESLDFNVRVLQSEVMSLAERMRRGDPSAYRTYKFRKRELKELSKRLRDLMRREQRRELQTCIVRVA